MCRATAPKATKEARGRGGGLSARFGVAAVAAAIQPGPVEFPQCEVDRSRPPPPGAGQLGRYPSYLTSLIHPYRQHQITPSQSSFVTTESRIGPLGRMVRGTHF